jgi:hypothetical protein
MSYLEHIIGKSMNRIEIRMKTQRPENIWKNSNMLFGMLESEKHMKLHE